MSISRRFDPALGGLLLLAFAFSSLFAAPALAQSASPPTVEEFRTDDGLTLRGLRYACADAPPVILVHGYGSNLTQFTVPGRDLAGFLQGQGYDVWCVNQRHAGRGRLASEGRADHSFDDVALFDVPAVVRAVRERTQQRPFLIGHSMGGMASLAWLQGTAWRRVTLGAGLATGRRVVGDPKLATERANSVRGVVAIGSPARMRWPEGARPVRGGNPLAHALARGRVAKRLSQRLPALPWKRTSDLFTDRLTKLPGFGKALRRIVRIGGQGPQVSIYFRPGSIDPDVLYRAMDTAVDDMSTTVMRQFADGVRNGGFRELHVTDPGRRPYSYADGHAAVRAPVLWIGGEFDELASHQAITATVERMATPDKSSFSVPMGHVDLVLGKRAPELVWRPILRWLDPRR